MNNTPVYVYKNKMREAPTNHRLYCVYTLTKNSIPGPAPATVLPSRNFSTRMAFKATLVQGWHGLLRHKFPRILRQDHTSRRRSAYSRAKDGESTGVYRGGTTVAGCGHGGGGGRGRCEKAAALGQSGNKKGQIKANTTDIAVS